MTKAKVKIIKLLVGSAVIIGVILVLMILGILEG